MHTVGLLGRLGDRLSEIDGVEEAFVFGSWAARDAGEPGPAPRDIDVLVLGDAALRAVRRACRGVEEDLRVEVNRWSSTAPAGTPEARALHRTDQEPAARLDPPGSSMTTDK